MALRARTSAGESAIDTSPAIFRLVLGAAPDATIAVDAAGRIVLANARAERIFGFEPDELLGLPVEQLLPEDLRKKHIKHRSGFSKHPYLREMGAGLDLQARRNDGSLFPVEISLSPVKVGSDDLVIASIRDVTEVRQLAAAADASRALFERVLDAAPDATLVVDEHGVIVLANGAATSIFGYSQQDLVGSPVEQLLPESLRRVHVEHRARFAKDPYRRAMGAGLELNARRADATYFPVEISLSPVEVGNRPLVIASVRDVTEAREVAGEVEKSRGLFEKVLEATPDPTVVVNAQGEIVFVNDQVEAVFQYPRSMLVGKGVELLVPDALRATHIQHRRHFMDEPYRREMGRGLNLRARRADGVLIPVEISLAPMFRGDEILVIAAIRDVTVRRLLADELERSNRDLNQFAYLASHDLQAPLRTVAGFTQVLMESLDNAELDEEQRRWAANIEQGVVHMQHLIRDLLAYSRLDSPTNPEPLVLATVARTVLAMLAVDARALNAQVTVAAPHSVQMDEASLRLILQNLIQNSMNHRDPGRDPVITIGSVALSNGFVELTVSDNGKGIPADFRESVFEMFKQLEGGGEGTGIGLSVVRRIAERHGGTAYVSPKPQEVGTTIVVTMPAAVPVDQQAAGI